MKTILTAIGGGIIGAIIVLTMQASNFSLIKPALAAPLSIEGMKCILDRMEDVYVEKSYYYLRDYCDDSWNIVENHKLRDCYVKRMGDVHTKLIAMTLEDYCEKF